MRYTNTKYLDRLVKLGVLESYKLNTSQSIIDKYIVMTIVMNMLSIELRDTKTRITDCQRKVSHSEYDSLRYKAYVKMTGTYRRYYKGLLGEHALVLREIKSLKRLLVGVL